MNPLTNMCRLDRAAWCSNDKQGSTQRHLLKVRKVRFQAWSNRPSSCEVRSTTGSVGWLDIAYWLLASLIRIKWGTWNLLKSLVVSLLVSHSCPSPCELG